MRRLQADWRTLGAGTLLILAWFAAPSWAQDTPRLFAPAPNTPAQAPADARTIPVVRSTLSDVPLPAPIAPPPPAIRATLVDAPPLRAAMPVTSAPPPTPSRYAPQKIAFAGGVTAAFDQTYATLSGFRPLTLDLYQPRSPGPLPLIVFIHGGGWNNGDSRHAAPFADFPAQLAALAAQGYVVASVNYRLSQEARFPAALQDVKAAIRWLRGHAGDYGIDGTRVAVWGMSAGGQLAALAGVSCGVPRFEPDRGADSDMPSDCVEAVIDWYGATDLEKLAADNGAPAASTDFKPGSSSAEGDYLGCEPAACPPAIARLSSPLAFINAMSPPFLIQHGGADTTVSSKQSQKLYDALKAQGVPATLEIYPGLGHEFTRGGAPDPVASTRALARVATFLAATFPARGAGGASLSAAAGAKPQIRRTVLN